MDHNYFVYILTNRHKNVVYTGVTNDIEVRLKQHFENSKGSSTHVGKYNCYYLVYLERHSDINYAIAREKEIKKWRREKKNNLIEKKNPNWSFLNEPESGIIYYEKLGAEFH